MKKGMNKVLLLALVTAMIVGALAGCGSSVPTNEKESADTSQEGKTYNGADISEHVDLRMYLLGERTPDFDEVYDEINKILEDKLNCSVSVDFLTWGEHDKKYSLLFSSQEDFDLIFTASSWGHYEQTVALGGFYPMTEEFVKTYASGIWEVVPEVAWSQAKINDAPYMVPNYQKEHSQDVFAVRKDLMEKYDINDITSWDELRKFYLACADDGIYAANGAPFYQYFQDKGLSTTGGAPKGGELILYNCQDQDDLSFTYLLDWDGFEEYCKEAKELADAGCWSADTLNSNDDRQTGLLTGRTAGMMWNMDSCWKYAKEANAEHPDWNVTLCDPVSSQPKKVSSYINNGMAINVNSKNPERAMMVLNEFYTNPQIQDLTMLGIEGKHWEAAGDNQYKIIDDSTYGIDSNCNWGWKNENIFRTEYVEERTALDAVRDTMKESFLSNEKEEHIYDGFNFDSSNVTTQMAAVEAAVGNYYDPLINGLQEDVEGSIEKMKAALESAGIRDIIAEMEKQASEYAAKKQGN